ncbi:MAG: Gfo/Idh/MocA family oxidoreductase [Gammaproteobacteria bacterium]|nr:Gfo/Idh/MocA family oxidoreductase [Gammaproteobacteria bacterium]
MPGPLKVGLVGTGGISNRHMDAYLRYPDRVRLTAVCDIVRPLAEEYAKKTGVEAVYTDYQEMLRDADIDAVDICTGHRHHAPQAIAAAEAGKHALTEKAMAQDLDECRAMIQAADKAGVTLMVAQHLRYSPEARAAKRLIEEGGLGDIQAARTHLIMSGPRKSWMNDANEGGGVLALNSIHHLDLLRYYVGNVKRVTGVCRSVQPEMLNGAEDLVAGTLEFENGAIGDMFASWTTYVAPGVPSYTVIGTKGTIQSTPPDLGDEDRPVAHFGRVLFAEKEALDPRNRPEDLKKIMEPPFEPIPTLGGELPSSNFFVNEILHFADCATTGAEPISSGRDNIESMKVMLGIFESSRTGKAINLGDL